MTNRKILIVEDDAGIRSVHEIFFGLQNLDVVMATTGAEALAKFGSDTFDIIVLDLGLPDMDGFDILKVIRQVSAVPVIIITARTDSESVKASMALGATEFVNKPFRPETLFRRINALWSTTSEQISLPLAQA